jgi:hypothetical protein
MLPRATVVSIPSFLFPHFPPHFMMSSLLFFYYAPINHFDRFIGAFGYRRVMGLQQLW